MEKQKKEDEAMKPKDFYNMLLYGTTRNETCGARGHYIIIHRIGNDSKYYIIFRDGKVQVYDPVKGKGCQLCMMVDDIPNGEYELFNSVQILKSGYVMLDVYSDRDVKVIISKLYDHVESEKDNILCGSSYWDDGLTDSFEYYATNGIEVKVRMIKTLCSTNVRRKSEGFHPIPFNPQMNNMCSFHVCFITDMTDKYDYDLAHKQCDEALNELKTFLGIITDNFRWVEVNMKKPCYV